ncbi:hypothetical protein P8452_28522 [Trifolium repens]|nr:hypothetical protein P8452_28522 [Trifolium repens]
MIADPDSEVVVFAQRTVKDLKLPPHFVTQISQSIQEFFNFVVYTKNKVLNSTINYANVSVLCKDLKLPPPFELQIGYIFLDHVVTTRTGIRGLRGVVLGSA